MGQFSQEVDSDLERETAIKTLKDETNDAERRAAVQKREALLHPALPSLVDMATWHIFVDTDCMTSDLKKLLEDSSIAITEKREKADIFVVQDPSDPGQRTKWWAIIKGSFLVTPSVLLQNNGPAIKYHAAMSTARRIWISPRAREKHSTLVEIVEFAVKKLPGSKWKLVTGSLDEFVAFYKKAAKAHRGCNMIGLVCKKEEKDCVCRRVVGVCVFVCV
jgi:hypothetical protein